MNELLLNLPRKGRGLSTPQAVLVGALLSLAALAAMALDAPLAKLEQWEVACGASTPKNFLQDSGGTTHVADSVYIANDSATCVRIGGSNVASGTGASIGSGCRDGSGISVDAKGGYCLSTSGTITVDVLAGKR